MDFVILTREPIRTEDFLQPAAPLPNCGARIWFEGIVRNHNNGKPVREIFYEAYEGMARKELQTILEEAETKWPVEHLGVVHRIGDLKVGETSLIVVVQAPHRKEAFAALQFVIDEIKKRAPIWKKEFYECEESGRPIGRWQEPPVRTE